nr:hypothetical protein CFP56_69060 [Quercus suber]
MSASPALPASWLGDCKSFTSLSVVVTSDCCVAELADGFCVGCILVASLGCRGSVNVRGAYRVRPARIHGCGLRWNCECMLCAYSSVGDIVESGCWPLGAFGDTPWYVVMALPCVGIDSLCCGDTLRWVVVLAWLLTAGCTWEHVLLPSSLHGSGILSPPGTDPRRDVSQGPDALDPVGRGQEVYNGFYDAVGRCSHPSDDPSHGQVTDMVRPRCGLLLFVRRHVNWQCGCARVSRFSGHSCGGLHVHILERRIECDVGRMSGVERDLESWKVDHVLVGSSFLSFTGTTLLLYHA